MSEHTPVPWKVEIRQDNIRILSGDKAIALMCVKPDNDHLYKPIVVEANAEFIVKACNEYEKLVTLIELADCPHCDGSGSYHHRNGIIQCQWCAESKAVIEKANKEN